MSFALTTLALTLALTLIGAAQANPVARGTSLTATVDTVSATKDIPVVSLDLGSVSPHGNVTAGAAGVHTSSADAIYPATIFVCRALGCGSCTGYDLSIQPHNTCLVPGFTFVSAYINQPSNQGLPYAVYTGPSGCGSFAQIPLVNTCYDASNYIGADFKLT